jgi:hypothetical protein
MQREIAVIAVLGASVALGAPLPIDESAMKAALERGAVDVVSLERHLGPPKVPDGPFARACESWKLTEDQVLAFFARATAIIPSELSTSFAVVPCQYSGSISINGELYNFSINAGSFGVIRGTPPDRVAIFGCKAACKDLFRIGADAE